MIKTIGDEVMVVGSDAGGARRLGGRLPGAGRPSRPLPRIGIHAGAALYRDGDYYGREVNLASRVAARAAGGEVLVTRPIVEAAGAAPRLRADRRGAAEGLLGADRAVPRRRADEGREACSRRASATAGCCAPGRVRRRAALRRARLGLPARPRRAARGRGAVSALHVDYGLRDDADARRRALRARCASGSASRCTSDRAPAPGATGNLQAWARDARYAEAARLRSRAARDVAAGHTATDQVETVLYRLAASPGRRALLGMARARRAARAPAARRHARGDRGALRGARAGLARGRQQRLARVRPQPRAPRAAAGAARAPPGGRGQRAAHARAAARRGRGARRASSTPRSPGRRPARASARCARCRPRSPARRAAARRRAPAAGAGDRAPRRRDARAAPRAARSTSAAACAPRSAAARCASSASRGPAAPHRDREPP